MKTIDLGVIDFQTAWDLQKTYVDRVIADRECGYFLLCEHPTVVTLGRLADRSHILVSDQVLRERNVSVVPIDRGGEATLHAPGQLVVYPICDLQRYGKDLHAYLSKLEQVGIDFLKLFGIIGNRIPGKTGVWIEDRKVISAGIGVRRWISFHGMSININMDLSLFEMIRPCGMMIPMTSIAQETSRQQDMDCVKARMVSVLKKEFGFAHV